MDVAEDRDAIGVCEEMMHDVVESGCGFARSCEMTDMATGFGQHG